MATEMTALLERKERIQKTKPGVLAIALGVWGIMIVLLFFTHRPLSLAPVTACVFTVTAVACYASRAEKLHLEMAERILELESRLGRIDKGESEPDAV